MCNRLMGPSRRKRFADGSVVALNARTTVAWGGLIGVAGGEAGDADQRYRYAVVKRRDSWAGAVLSLSRSGRAGPQAAVPTPVWAMSRVT